MQARNLIGEQSYPKSLSNLHPAISRLLDEDEHRRAKQLASKYPSSWDAPIFDTRFERRRLKIINSLFMLLARTGAKPYISGKEGRDTSVIVGEQRVPISIDSPANLKLDRHEFQRQTEPTDGKLRIEIFSFAKLTEIRTIWEDEKGSKLEKHIKDMAVSVIVAGEILYRHSVIRAREWYIREKSRLEEELRKKMEEDQRREQERIRRIQQERIDQLLNLSEAYRQANQIRDLVTKMHAVGADNISSVGEADLNTWAIWALSVADRLDPVVSGAFLESIQVAAKELLKSERLT